MPQSDYMEGPKHFICTGSDEEEPGELAVLA